MISRKKITILFLILISLSLFASAIASSVKPAEWQPYMLIAALAIPYFILTKQKNPIDICGVFYNTSTDKIQMIVKNNLEKPLYMRSSLRTVKTTVACDWRVADDERIDYSLDVPMMPAKFEKLRRLYTLIAEDDSVHALKSEQTRVLEYAPMQDFTIGDEIAVTIDYGLGKSKKYFELLTPLRVRQSFGVSLGIIINTAYAGVSLSETFKKATEKIRGFAS